MPTIPVIIEIVAFPFSFVHADGWVGTGKTYESTSFMNPACHTLNDTTGWQANVAGSTTIPISDISIIAAPANGISGKANLTYPDVAGGTPAVAFFLSYVRSNQITHQVQATFTLPLQEVANTVQRASFVASVASGTVTFALTFLSAWVDWDGVNYHQGADRAELRVGGVVYPFTLTSSSTGITGSSSAVTGSDSLTHIITTRIVSYTGSVSFPLSAQDLDLRIGNSYGEWLNWERLTFRPQGIFDLTSVEDDMANLDASGVYVIGGHIHDANGLRYTFSNGSIAQPFLTDQAQSTHDVSAGNLSDGDTLTAYLQATSQTGCVNTFSDSATATGSRPHAMSDHDGVAYIAWRTDGNVDILEYKDGRSTKRVLSTITNATPCALYRHESDSEVYLVTRDGASGNVVLQRSSDIGRTWTIMATLPLPNSDYKNHAPCGLSDGGHASAAIKRSDGFLYFTRSVDGIIWSTPARLKDASGNPLAITIGAKGIVMREETASHSSRIVLTNNDSFMVSSDSTGESWAHY